MARIDDTVVWDSVRNDGWSYCRERRHISILTFELSRVPDFSSARFENLGEMDSRAKVVSHRQMLMLHQLYELAISQAPGKGNHCALALRLIRESSTRVRFLVLVRFADNDPASASLMEERAAHFKDAFIDEYRFDLVQPDTDRTIEQALKLDWANHIDEVIKDRRTYTANTFPFFYVPSLFGIQALNDLESLTRALTLFGGQIAVDITLVPAAFDSSEHNWLEKHLAEMRDALGGQHIYGRDGTEVLKRFPPMPGLKAPVENFEDLLKRYPTERLFLFAIRTIADRNPVSVTSNLIAGATTTQPTVISLKSGDLEFGRALRSAEIVDVAPEVHVPWWEEDKGNRPFRAQRLHRLADVGEISPFWRLPIPMHERFPGILLDRGIGRVIPESKKKDVPLIDLGTFMDEAPGKETSAQFDREGFTKHGLIVGTPGSGKTTLMFDLLHQLWAPTEHRVAFMVLEPAKTEYRALKHVPLFRDDLLVFTLGNEHTSPFRFNPFYVPDGISLESHISRLNACFVAAFDLFDPLPMLLDQAIRDVYDEKGWTELAIGGGPGCGQVPTLADLHAKGKEVADHADYVGEVKSNIRAALDLRLASLLRGSRGDMLNTLVSVPIKQLMGQPIILELDALNQDERALVMMFILTFVYEYAKSTRRSGSPLSHVLVIEEAHNLIGRTNGPNNRDRANPKEHAIELFVRMLAEMRALGQGLLIADQLPTALAPEAMKNTNLKLLMRLTAMDDRLEIGNTMGLDEDAPAIEGAVHLSSGRAYAFLEEWDRVRLIRTRNYKRDHEIERPQADDELKKEMATFEESHLDLYMPFAECGLRCKTCDRPTRSAARWTVRRVDRNVLLQAAREPKCQLLAHYTRVEAKERLSSGKETSSVFSFCLLLHLWYQKGGLLKCSKPSCECREHLRSDVIELV